MENDIILEYQVKQFIEGYCDIVGVKFENFQVSDNRHHITDRKKVLLYMLYTKYGIKTPRLAEMFNLKTPAAARYSIKAFEERRGYDSFLDSLYEQSLILYRSMVMSEKEEKVISLESKLISMLKTKERLVHT